MIAIKRLQSIMWILVIAMGALSAYLVSLRVATERNAVVAVERQIYATRKNIRYLEVEFSARASMRQLAEWNARDIRYSVPGEGQYLRSEQQLASLDEIEPNGTPFAAPPVMAAAASAEPEAEPAMIVPVKAQAPAQAATPKTESATFTLVRAPAGPATPKIIPAVAKVKPEATPRIVNLVDKADPAQRRAMRLAKLEETLLDMRVPGQAGKAAR